jgi:hypothetical protein
MVKDVVENIKECFLKVYFHNCLIAKFGYLLVDTTLATIIKYQKNFV